MQSPSQDEQEIAAEDAEAETWLLWAMTCELLSNARALSRSISSRVVDVLGRYPMLDEVKATAEIRCNRPGLFV